MSDKITIQGEGSEIALLDRIITLRRRVEELERLVSMLEWIPTPMPEMGRAWIECCLFCRQNRWQGHAPDCPRQALGLDKP